MGKSEKKWERAGKRGKEKEWERLRKSGEEWERVGRSG